MANGTDRRGTDRRGTTRQGTAQRGTAQRETSLQSTTRQKERPARDLAVEAQTHADAQKTFVRHALTRFPLVGVFVITINLSVQVRGDVGLAVAVAQNLTFGAIAVIVMLNLVLYILLGVMVCAIPLVLDPEYNRWTRVVGAAVLALLTVVLAFMASWLLLAAVFVIFVVTAAIMLRRRRNPRPPVTRETLDAQLLQPVPPLDSRLRSLWADGRAMIRVISPSRLPVTAVEAAMDPAPEPRTFADVAAGWAERTAQIGAPRSKSLTRLAFAGIVGFIALFGLNVLTQPIRFAPLELVSIAGAEPARGFVLLQGPRGVFVPDPFGTAKFISATDITSIELCDDPPRWWSVSIADLVAPVTQSGVDCSGS